MSGEQLKNLLSDMGFANVSELALLLGMKNAQNLHAAFSAQDIKTGLLEDIAKALDIPVADFYPANNAVAEHGSAICPGNKRVTKGTKKVPADNRQHQPNFAQDNELQEFKSVQR